MFVNLAQIDFLYWSFKKLTNWFEMLIKVMLELNTFKVLLAIRGVETFATTKITVEGNYTEGCWS